MTTVNCHAGAKPIVLAMLLLACTPARSPTVAGPSGIRATPDPAQVAISAPTAATLAQIVFATSDPSIAFGPLYVGMGTGFFREAGLDVRIQVMSANLALAALANNQDIDHTSLPGSVVRGAARNLPVRVVGIWFEKTRFFLMARPEVRTLADLRGKVLAVTAFGSSTDLVLRDVLRDTGIDPESETTIIQLGAGAARLAGVAQGAAVAGLFAAPDNVVAEQQGLHRIPSRAEDVPVVFSGIGVSEKKLQDQRTQTENVLRATLRTLRFMRAEPQQASDFVAAATDIDRDVMRLAYQSMIDALSPDGWAAPEALTKLLKDSTPDGESVPPESQVYEPGPLKSAQRALGVTGRP